MKLAEEGVDFRLAIAGENTRVDPREFTEACHLLGDRVVQVGYLPRLAYTELLGEADVVVSAARHEFFGIAVVEAIAGGAVPVLPCRLSYPELISDRYQAVALYPDGGLTTRLREVLEDLGWWRSQIEGLADATRRFDWSVVIDDYDTRLERLAIQAQSLT
jgi:glycosyltransferase involved in cell wall biosynthesis